MKHQLDFEKPIAELQRKLDELRKHPEAHAMGINLEEEVARIERKIVLIGGRRLAELMIDHGIGVATAQTYAVKKVDLDYFEEDDG